MIASGREDSTKRTISSGSRVRHLHPCGPTRKREEGDGWVAEARRLYAGAAQAAADALDTPTPQGGTFLFFDGSPWLAPDEEDCSSLLTRCRDAGVMLTPGVSCGSAYARWARLCFTAVPPDRLAASLVALRSALAT